MPDNPQNRVELRGLEPLTPTLPARVTGGILCRVVPGRHVSSPQLLTFVPARGAGYRHVLRGSG